KPANVMVGAFGEVQVMDWGLAKVLAPAPAVPAADAAAPVSTVVSVRADTPELASQAGAVVGAPAVMAPEPARGEGGRGDEGCGVFGLGAILCVLLTGRPPYQGPSTAEVLRQAMWGEAEEALARLDGCGADAELVRLAKACLARRREDRLRDAGAVAEA